MSLLSVGWHHRVPASCTFVCERQIKDRLFIEGLPDQLQPNGKAVSKTTRHGNCTQTAVVDQTGRQSRGRLRHILYFWGRIQGGRRQYRIQTVHPCHYLSMKPRLLTQRIRVVGGADAGAFLDPLTDSRINSFTMGVKGRSMTSVSKLFLLYSSGHKLCRSFSLW